MRNTAFAVLLFLAILGAMAAKSLLIQAPGLRTASEAGEFDAPRAMQRLARALGDERPHPADTPANDAVRERIVAELRALSLSPRISDGMACNALEKSRGVSCARVRNVVATIGPAAGRHLLLNAHYDSSPVGPGAGDDGVGLATLLEVAAILRSERLDRPVTLLFNEGEELGLLGARAFLDRDPLNRSVDTLVNLEARGVTGPVSMFETSMPNAAPIAAFSRAVERPVANSLATDFYRLLPNYTDVNTFATRGWTTLNLAMVGNETRYHSAGDDLAALDPRSLQHMGDQTLSLARELAAGSPPASSGNRLFMDLLGRELVTLPAALGLAVLELLLLAMAWVCWRRGALARGLAVMLAALLLSAALGWAGESLVTPVSIHIFYGSQETR